MRRGFVRSRRQKGACEFTSNGFVCTRRKSVPSFKVTCKVTRWHRTIQSSSVNVRVSGIDLPSKWCLWVWLLKCLVYSYIDADVCLASEMPSVERKSDWCLCRWLLKHLRLRFISTEVCGLGLEGLMRFTLTLMGVGLVSEMCGVCSRDHQVSVRLPLESETWHYPQLCSSGWKFVSLYMGFINSENILVIYSYANRKMILFFVPNWTFFRQSTW